MSDKRLLEITGLGTVVFIKRKQARHIRVTIDHHGQAKVSLPSWVPYRTAVAFVQSKHDWVLEQQQGKTSHVFQDQERIGKAHRLRIMTKPSGAVTTRVTDTEIAVKIPSSLAVGDPSVQARIERAAVRALKKEAQELLLPRLKMLAERHGFEYRQAAVKRLKSRWGSCSSAGDIALNCYLMQLPWALIDYVLLHELVHTQVMAHGSRFWSVLGRYVKDLPEKRKAMRRYHPALAPQD